MNKKFVLPFLALAVISCIGLYCCQEDTPVTTQANMNYADIAWMLTSAGLVLLMTPGLSFFYGGMVSKKNIISTMLQSFISLGVITVLYVFVGFIL
jgi:ammonium transporter, Amt family